MENQFQLNGQITNLKEVICPFFIGSTQLIMNRLLNFTQYNSEKTTEMVKGDADWTDIVTFLQSYMYVTDKNGNKLFSGAKWIDETDPAAIFTTNAYNKTYFSRGVKNVLGADLLILDIDNGGCTRDSMIFTLDQVKTEFKDYEYVCYTSYNHRNPAKDHGVDKFRVVIPLAEFCPKDQWVGRLESFKARFGHLQPDDKSWEISQPMYVPIMHPDRKEFAVAWHNTGKWFDWTELEYKSPDELKQIHYTQTKSDIDASGLVLTADSVLETKNGSVMLGNVTQKISGVKCPFHADNSPGEFIAINSHGRPFLHCKKCGTIHMTVEKESIEVDESLFLQAVKAWGKSQSVKKFWSWMMKSSRKIVSLKPMLTVILSLMVS